MIGSDSYKDRLIVYLINIPLYYLGYLVLTPAILINLAFIIILIFSFASLGYESEIFRFATIFTGLSDNRSLQVNTDDIVSYYWQFSLVFMFLGIIITYINKKTFRLRFPMNNLFSHLKGVVLPSVLAPLVFISTFFTPWESEINSRLFVFLFWFVAVFSYLFYKLLKYTALQINRLALKGNSNKILNLTSKQKNLIISLFPDIKDYALDAYRKSVQTGEWDQIKKELDPETVKKIEESWNNQK